MVIVTYAVSSRCSTVGGIAHSLGLKALCHNVLGISLKRALQTYWNQRIPGKNDSVLFKSFSVSIHKLVWVFGFQWPSGRIAT